ncbi:MAG: TRAP transporter large permease subunit [Alphaproteobacteria bacterium]|nr:TRAP transporter large permease subunit [Alphaproteobacteria bacterium]
MELLFLALLVILMAGALASGFPVAFALPGAAIISIMAAGVSGYLFAGNVDAFFHQGGPSNWLSAGVTNFRGIYWEAERDTLIAIPLFVFMGIMLQRSKVAEDLLVTMAQLFGPIRGGLGISVVFVGALLAATTGILGATVVAMGLISLPAMLRNNYSHPLATGTIAASGTLGQIIPPSIVLIILADQLSSAVDQAGTARQNIYKEVTGELSMPSEFAVTSTSAGDMFMGAVLPGLVLVGLYMLFILISSIIKPKLAPAVPFDGEYDRKFALKVVLALVPPLTLIFAVLGSIITGIATVNQAGAIGAAGAMIMAGYRLTAGKPGCFRPAILAIISVITLAVVANIYEVNVRRIETAADTTGLVLAVIAAVGFLTALAWSGWRIFKIDNTLQGVMMETAKTTSLVFIILLGAAMLTAAFRAFGGEELVRDFLGGLPGGFWTQFIIVMLVIFLLGFFLDFIEIAVVVVPIVAPILLADPEANITAVWLGVMIGMNIQTSFLTPPFGFALFYLRGVAPKVIKTVSMYKGVIPFICLQLFALAIVGYFPPLVNYLPNRTSLIGETAPPPKNPRLQYCIENYLAVQYVAQGPQIAALIDEAKTWDLSALPNRDADDLAEAIEKAGTVPGLMAAAVAAKDAIDVADPGYRPLHEGVRRLQAKIRDLNEKIEDKTRLAGQLEGFEETQERAARYREDVEEYIVDRDAMLAEIPAEWEAEHAEFVKILEVEKKARTTYRRTADQAYDPLPELMLKLRDVDALAALRGELDKLEAFIKEETTDAEQEAIKAIEDVISDVEGTSKVKSAVSSMRRDLRPGRVKIEDAREELAEAYEEFEKELAWRQAAAPDLLPKLERLEAGIRLTIGLRQQDKMPRDIALEVAKCEANHRDISLYF